jgi:hypothetical protein
MATITLPAHWTEAMVQDFMQKISSPSGLSNDKKRPERNCKNCYNSDGINCIIHSCDCINAVFNHESPPRWMPKKGEV